MKLFVIADIFGKTDHLDQMINDVSPGNEEVEIIDPYNNKTMSFKNENEAYNSFVNEVGLIKYSNMVYQAVFTSKASTITILSFSIGASAVWAVSSRLSPSRIQKCICFYSSQIRNYLEIKPKIEIDLYFAKNEPKYNVSEIFSFLSENKKVNCFKTYYQHAFMNKCSSNFNENGYNEYIKIIKNCITSRSTTLRCASLGRGRKRHAS